MRCHIFGGWTPAGIRTARGVVATRRSPGTRSGGGTGAGEPMTDLVTLTDAKNHLGIPLADTTEDAELQGFIDAAGPIVEYIIGPVTQVSVTETYRVAGRSRILLRTVPILTVQTVTEYIGATAYTLTPQPLGASQNNYGYTVDSLDAGLLVRRGAVGNEMPFIGVTAVVGYTAGRAQVDPDVRLAVLEDIRAIWQQTQQGGRPTWGGVGAAEDGWGGVGGPVHMFPRLAAMLEGRARTQSIV